MNSFSSNIAKGTEATLISKQKCFLDLYLSYDRSPVSRAVADEALSTKPLASLSRMQPWFSTSSILNKAILRYFAELSSYSGEHADTCIT
jgi:hypothetical protein